MKAKLKAPIKSLNQSILVKNEQITRFYAPHHYHSDYEIIYIKKSFEIRIVGNNIDNYQAGDVVILGSGFPHYHVVGENKKESGNYIETIAMFFPQSIIESNSKFLEFAQINSTLEKLKYGIKLKKQTKKAFKNYWNK